MLQLVFVFSCWILNIIFSHRITSVDCSSRPAGTVDVLIYKPQKKSRGGGLAQKETRGVRPGPTWEETGSIWQCQDVWSVLFLPISGGELTYTMFVQAYCIGPKFCCGCGWLRIGTEWWAIHNFKLWHFGMFFVDASKLWTKIIEIKHNETPWQWFRTYRKPMFLFFFRWRWQVTMESKDVLNLCFSQNRPWLGVGFIHIFYFHHEIWGRWTQFDEHIFQMGWFNHQPDDLEAIIETTKLSR